MAELSKDTIAIIDRLKAEGLLTRNSGTNSLKSVKEALTEQLQPAFNAMREALTGMSSANDEFNKLKAERDMKLLDLNEEQREEYIKNNAEMVIREQEYEKKDLARKEKEQKKKDRQDLKIFGKDGILLSGIKKTFSFAMIAGVAALGYSAISGFLEGYLPEYFGPEGKIADLPSVFEIVGSIKAIFTSVDVEQLKENLSYISSANFLSAMTVAAGGYGALKVLEKGAGVVSTIALAKMFTPGSSDASDGSLKVRKTAIRVGIAGLVFSAIQFAMPMLTNFFRSNDFTPEALSKVPLRPADIASIGGNALSAGTVAMLFAPAGPIAAGIAGLVTFMGMTALDIMGHNQDADTYSNEFEDLLLGEMSEVAYLKNRKERLENITKNYNLSDDLANRLSEEIAQLEADRLSLEPEVLKKSLASIDSVFTELNELSGVIDEEDVAKRTRIQSTIDRTSSTLFTPNKGAALAGLYLAKAITGGSDDDASAIVAEANERRERAGVLLRQMSAQFAAQPELFNEYLKAGRLPPEVTDPESFQAFINAKYQFRNGTQGFTNFGRGSLAVLHGEEAVIKRASLEGQILENLRSGTTIAGMTDKIASAMTGNSGSPIIVNNVNNSTNPISVQSSTGGARVANTRISGGGGGGGGSYIDMPGLVT
jgi:hypothetical protein